jgi:cholesterol transport system auxiliary component
MSRFFSGGTVLLLMACMTGCGVLPKKENIQVIVPQVKVAPDAAWPTVSWQLAVARPVASKLLDSNRIAVSPTPGTMQIYHGASWNDAAPDVFEDVVVAAFEDSGRILAVGRQATAVRADYMLAMDMRHFEAVYADPKTPPDALIAINAKLIDSNGHVVAMHTFRQSVAASGTAVPEVAHAFDTGLGAIAAELVGWTLDAGQRAHAAAKAPRK